jgi:uncharacterized membrane protein
MDGLLFTATFLAALGSGLVAGAFFAFSAFVMPALSRLPASSGIAAMRAITTAIRGAPFLILFFGTVVLTALLALAAPFRWSEPDALYLLAGGLLYLNGPFAVTLLRNLPLNNQLAGVKAHSSGTKVWTEYQSAWTLWNHVRAGAALAAAACFIAALVRQAA